MKVRIFTLIAIVYLFFDTLGLPFGLKYTAFLAPIICFNLIPKYFNFFLVVLFFFVFYFVIHFFYGIVSYFEYFKSLIFHFVVLVVSVGFYDKLSNKPIVVYESLETLTKLNIIATIFALLTFNIPYFRGLYWRDYYLTDFPQLEMLTFEPSYYSFLMVPLFFYYFTLENKAHSWKNVFFIGSLSISFLLSRSLGVIASIILSILIFYFNFNFIKKHFQKIIVVLFFIFFGLTAFIILNPENVFVVRIFNFLEGNDPSGAARVVDVWYLGYEILKQKSFLFGIGWGHVKILGHEIISNFYNYPPALNKRVTIPNSVAEIYIILGFSGLFLKLFFECYLYKKTKVKDSTFRKLLFWFMFIYQFTGSYSAWLSEYIVWIFAFTKTDYFVNYFKEKKLQYYENRN